MATEAVRKMVTTDEKRGIRGFSQSIGDGSEVDTDQRPIEATGGLIGSELTAEEGTTAVGGGAATDRSLSRAKSSIGATDNSMDDGERRGAMGCAGEEGLRGGRWMTALVKKTARGIEW